MRIGIAVFEVETLLESHIITPQPQFEIEPPCCNYVVFICHYSIYTIYFIMKRHHVAALRMTRLNFAPLCGDLFTTKYLMR
ncbi:hypothetical protein RSOLAG1IB_07136 [Rhizoctonia solani AG-1 IB]|uniref:Uncharacterized protein n=1 Tax=Thanatephorus cucumeris (strain AG1-IB / isolate 7/3/14) TaxID=1108050 RepID=A0A0B7FEA0_THACB|nr:hypothetical protein RSOLAG1IB_07136 [Rhizoctonia solani AG-1 IB]